ncbi:GNAT family N-acetyltransferase [Ostreibacterium oceani]|uniref:AAA family ATPase n=1 Tax=Ostreibacterium oceani TaxID=2654998 RepID=A0A6N7EUS9_9GAMM|nr:GNAT family N-acetyltransferase [Ostreibacterium oceani]MPV85365.1 AAA family ATPase [Ostreibacterium oceani]
MDSRETTVVPSRLARCVILHEATEAGCPLEQLQAYLKKQDKRLNIAETTVIDLISDGNQTRWLGQELGDTVVIFNYNLNLNNWLCILNCIRGGHTVYLVYVHHTLTKAQNCLTVQTTLPRLADVQLADVQQVVNPFVHQVLLPQLRQIALVPKVIAKITPKTALKANEIIPKASNNNGLRDEQAEILQFFCSHRNLDGYEMCQIIGKRGTGKSTLLGQLAELYCRNGQQVVIVAPSRGSAKNLLSQLANVSRETWQFLVPDKITTLTKSKIRFDVLIIDEAATLPKAFMDYAIAACKNNAGQLIAATTTDGYETTGQSYREHYLETPSKAVRIFQLQQIQRFACDDPLFLLTQQFIPTESVSAVALPDGVHMMDTQSVIDAGIMQGCHALLQKAHYKSTPNDAMALYNRPAWFAIAVKNNWICAVAYVLIESLPAEVQLDELIAGRRRVKSAFTQQSVLAAYGHIGAQMDTVVRYPIARIVRIVTAHEQRRCGYATMLVNEIEKHLLEKSITMMSASFSARESSLRFWCSVGFTPVKLSLSLNKWDNLPAILMLRAVDQHACYPAVTKTQSIHKQVAHKQAIHAQTVHTQTIHTQEIKQLYNFFQHHVACYQAFYQTSQAAQRTLQTLMDLDVAIKANMETSIAANIAADMVANRRSTMTANRQASQQKIAETSLDEMDLLNEINKLEKSHRPASYFLPVLINSPCWKRWQQLQQQPLGEIQHRILTYLPFEAIKKSNQPIIKQLLTQLAATIKANRNA